MRLQWRRFYWIREGLLEREKSKRRRFYFLEATSLYYQNDKVEKKEKNSNSFYSLSHERAESNTITIYALNKHKNRHKEYN